MDDGKKKESGSLWERFLSAFSFTDERGKQKSGRGIEAFALSLAYLALYGALFCLVIDGLTPALSALPAFLQNLVESLLVSGIGVLVLFLLSRKLPYWALSGALLWLLGYGTACLVILLVLLLGTEGADLGAVFSLFFFLCALPAGSGLLALHLLFRNRKKGRAEEPETEEPAWKKYINTKR